MGCKHSKIASPISNNIVAQEKSERSEAICEVTSKNEIETYPKTTNVATVGSEETRIQVAEPLQKAENSLISNEKISYYVHKALEIYLPGYHIDCLEDTPCDRRTYVMRSIKYPYDELYPDQTGKFLTYSSLQSRNDRLHVCFKRNDPSLVKFLYQIRAGPSTYITSPYHGNYLTNNAAVRCDQGSITEALQGEFPIVGIVKVLGQLESSSVVDNGFDGADFLWKMRGNFQNFTIRVYPDSTSGYLYWSATGSSAQDANVLATNLESMKVHLELIQL